MILEEEIKKEKVSSILVIDDVVVNIKILEHSLKKNNYLVHTATNTISAREILEKHGVDIILLDINMPDENGYQFCKYLRSIDKFILLPVIFITAIDKEIGMEIAIQNGGDDYITKPIDIKLLLTKLKAFERIKRLQDIVIEQNFKLNVEMQVARKIQEHIVPFKKFNWNGIAVQTYFKPFLQVGGDYVDAWEKDGKLHIIIADCSGHGPSAALISAMLKMQLYTMPQNISLIDSIKILRKNLISVMPENYAITYFYGVISKDYSMEYVNGGHPAPILYKNNQILELEGRNPSIVDLQENTEIKVFNTILEKDNIVFLYTDGLSEAIDDKNQMLEIEGIKSIILNSIHNEKEFISSIMNGLQNHIKNENIQDDVAILTLMFN